MLVRCSFKSLVLIPVLVSNLVMMMPNLVAASMMMVSSLLVTSSSMMPSDGEESDVIYDVMSDAEQTDDEHKSTGSFGSFRGDVPGDATSGGGFGDISNPESAKMSKPQALVSVVSSAPGR